MSKIKLMAIGCGTLAVALVVGHFIQNNGNSARIMAHSVPQAPKVAEAPVDVKAQEMISVADLAEAASALDINAITHTSALPTAPDAILDVAALPSEPVTLASAEVEPITKMPLEEPTPAFGCDYVLSAEAAAGAMVALTLDVPCMPNERFTLHHNGLMITEVTGEDGTIKMTVPALSAAATYIVAFPNGEGAVANATVDSLEYYDRVALQWEGDSGLQVHAMEYGAEYGDAGHVWADAPHDLSQAVGGQGGFLTRLGAGDLQNAYQAEIYTFPSSLAARGGDVHLQVEAQVTRDNCGRDVEAQSIQVQPDGVFKVQTLTLAMPECNAVGDFLVLKNLLNDLKIAQN
ncbi:hypothetical protein G5B38_11585 [Pseudohalocynthiibacter aestuariivivens]|nr:hypothetical protein [Pseudohalocynthiibacter aestuariivivens]QIE46110.1 hypothetical protein G5B38_11585 [Pseudohalocynthiibacter aestuariivivens]